VSVEMTNPIPNIIANVRKYRTSSTSKVSDGWTKKKS
jgi:hypothetical protein